MLYSREVRLLSLHVFFLLNFQFLFRRDPRLPQFDAHLTFSSNQQ